MRNRIFLIIMLFAGMFVILLFSSMLLLQRATIDDISVAQLENQTKDKLEFLTEYVEHRTSLLKAFLLNKDVIEFVKTQENQQSVEDLFLTQARISKDIFQIRYLDQDGNEIIRVNNYYEPSLVPSSQLQNKATRYYFKDTMKLGHGEIYYSNFDLNIEHSEIESTYIPTVRIATPIKIDNQSYGMIIINVNIKHFLSNLQKSTLHYVSLVYGNGDIIVNNSEIHNWSRDFNLNLKIYDIYKDLPQKSFETKATKSGKYFIQEIPLSTKESIYLLLTTKEFRQFTALFEYIKDRIYLLLALTLIGIPTAYFFSGYIDQMIRRRVLFNRVKSNNRLINSVINSTTDLIFYKDKDFNLLGCNRAFQGFVGKSKESIIGYSDYELFEAQLADDIRSMDQRMLEENRVIKENKWLKYNTGKEVYFQLKRVPFVYDETGDLGILTIGRDITDLHKAHEMLKEESYSDPLTQSFNRKAYKEKINERLNMYHRYGDQFCFAMFDIDNFKNINDTYGHDVGDLVLTQMVQVIQDMIRKTDILFRMGGEEFSLLFPKTDLESAHTILEKIRVEISEMGAYP